MQEQGLIYCHSFYALSIDESGSDIGGEEAEVEYIKGKSISKISREAGKLLFSVACERFSVSESQTARNTFGKKSSECVLSQIIHSKPYSERQSNF